MTTREWQLQTHWFQTVVPLTHWYPSEDKQSDAGGHPQQAIAESTNQQAGEERVLTADHITPAALRDNEQERGKKTLVHIIITQYHNYFQYEALRLIDRNVSWIPSENLLSPEL